MGGDGKAGFPQHNRSRQSNYKPEGKLSGEAQLHQPHIRCPQCSSQKLYKDGIRYTLNSQIQRWLCRNCGYRFSEKKALQKSLSGPLNIASVISSNCQGSCEAPSGAPSARKAVQTLVEVATRTEKPQREGTRTKRQ